MPKVSDEYRAARREQILDAAAACCAREGFHRTTMQDIVREAQLSPGAVYGYFTSKDEIIEAIAAERHAREAALLNDVRGLPAAQALRNLARSFLGALARPQEQRQRRVGVQIWAEALRDPRVLRVVRRGIDEPIRVLVEVLREAQQRGEVSANLDPESAARAVIAVFHGFVLQQCWDPRVKVAPYLTTVEAIIDGFVTEAAPVAARRR
jgi:AcrR family transcriptional regulator